MWLARKHIIRPLIYRSILKIDLEDLDSQNGGNSQDNKARGSKKMNEVEEPAQAAYFVSWNDAWSKLRSAEWPAYRGKSISDGINVGSFGGIVLPHVLNQRNHEIKSIQFLYNMKIRKMHDKWHHTTHIQKLFLDHVPKGVYINWKRINLFEIFVPLVLWNTFVTSEERENHGLPIFRIITVRMAKIYQVVLRWSLCSSVGFSWSSMSWVHIGVWWVKPMRKEVLCVHHDVGRFTVPAQTFTQVIHTDGKEQTDGQHCARA